MSEHDSTLPTAAGPTRRTIVRVGAHAAWAAPVILAASTAPAMASSGAGIFTINRGDSFYNFDRFTAFVQFQGFSLIANGLDIDLGTLQMSITTSGDGASHLRNQSPGGQWSDVGPAPGATISWVYGAAVSGDSGAPNFDIAFRATLQDDFTLPTFTVQFTHPDYTTAVEVFQLPAGRSARTTAPPAGVKLPSPPR